jgi:hypothetical protein
MSLTCEREWQEHQSLYENILSDYALGTAAQLYNKEPFFNTKPHILLFRQSKLVPLDEIRRQKGSPSYKMGKNSRTAKLCHNNGSIFL